MSAAGGSPPEWEATGMIAAPNARRVAHPRLLGRCQPLVLRSHLAGETASGTRSALPKSPRLQGTPLRFAVAIAMHRCQAAPAEA